MSAPKVLFYVQHLLGIGHLARASRIASALAADGFDLMLVTGGAPVAGFPAAGIRQVTLPPIVASDAGFGGLAGMDGAAVDDAFKAGRRDMLLAEFSTFQPDIVMVEAFPFGRRQMRFELLPLLDAVASTRPKPLLVSSVRDILQERVKPGRNEESRDLIKQHFDQVLVHGDPGFVRLEDTFPLAAGFSDRISYTGLVAGPPALPSPDKFDVVVSAGGGAAGSGLVAAGVAAAGQLPDRSWLLITGPNLPQEQYDAAVAVAPENLTIARFCTDFPALLAAAELSVSQAGYNTVCDVLQAGCGSLLVPFAAGGETEQTARAERLAALGLASMIGEDALDAATLVEAARQALLSGRPPRNSLNLGGAAGSVRALRTLIGSRSTQ